MSRLATIVGLTGLVALVLSGCGLGLMQTAKTTPRGEVDVALASGYIYNDMVSERGSGLANFPVQFGMRIGATDQLDVGISQFLLLGAQADVKYNFLPPGHPLALSLQAGFGGASNLESGHVLHVPVRALMSYEMAGITPYLGAGFGIFWVRDYDPKNDVPDSVPARGHGDGLVMLNAGVEFFSDKPVRLLVEYAYLTQVLDDPGDYFSFADNHIVHVGTRF